MKPPPHLFKPSFLNFWLPIILSLFVFTVSAVLEYITWELQFYWLQRSGSLIVVFGAWIAFAGQKLSVQMVDNKLFWDTELPHTWVSLILLSAGTVLWGYGDLLISLIV